MRLFGDSFVPVCSPRLLREKAHPLKVPLDLRQHCLLHMDHGPGTEVLEWPLWLRAMQVEGLKPASVLHFSQYDQMIQAAINGQGVGIGRLPSLDTMLAQRKLVAPFKRSVVSPRSYYLFQSDASRRKPEVREFLAWLIAEAGDGATTPDPGSSGRAGRARA